MNIDNQKIFELIVPRGDRDLGRTVLVRNGFASVQRPPLIDSRRTTTTEMMIENRTASLSLIPLLPCSAGGTWYDVLTKIVDDEIHSLVQFVQRLVERRQAGR